MIPNHALKFMNSGDFDKAQAVLIGMPFDGTSSYRPGSRFAPQSIREASYGLESYSPFLDRDLEEIAFYDAGDLEFSFGNAHKMLEQAEQICTEILCAGKIPVSIGGEHLIALSPFQAIRKQISEEIVLLHLDAHADLRENYLGETLSHATAIHLMSSLPNVRLVQWGIRSGTREEWQQMQNKGSLLTQLEDLSSILKGQRVYLTFDLDIFDPACFPGTGTPEPGGIFWKDFEQFLSILKKINCQYLGFDVVELAPHYDPSGRSSLLAAKVIRELLLLILHKK